MRTNPALPALALLMVAACSRGFVAPPSPAPADAGPQSPELVAVSPAAGYAGQTVVLQGARFATGAAAAALNQIRFGATPAEIAPDGGPTALVVVIPNLGSSAATTQVSVSTNGLPAPTTLPFTYEGPGHPVGFSASPVSDLSPTPGPIAVVGGFEATSLDRRWVNSIFNPITGIDVPHAGTSGYTGATTSLFLDPGLGPNAWFVAGALAREFGGSYPVVVSHADISGAVSDPDNFSLYLCGVVDPNVVVPLAEGLLVFADDGSLDAQPNSGPCPGGQAIPLPILYQVEPQVFATATALDATGTLGTIAALSQCGGGGGTAECLSVRQLQLDGGVATTFPAFAVGPLDGGLEPTQVALSPYSTDGGDMIYLGLSDPASPTTLVAVLSTPLIDGVPSMATRPTLQPFAISALRSRIAAGQGSVASLVEVPPTIDIADLTSRSVTSVALPGIPQAVTTDPLSPDRYYVAIASPPELLSVTAGGLIDSQRTLSAGLLSAVESPGADQVAVSFDRLPGLATLDAATLALPPPDYTFPNVLFGTPFQQEGALGSSIPSDAFDQATWVGDGVLCGLSAADGGRVVRCGAAQYLMASAFEPPIYPWPNPPCVITDAIGDPAGRAVLRYDPPDGLVVYSGPLVQRYSVDLIPDGGGAGGPLVQCGPATPEGSVQPGWTTLSVTPDGSAGVEAGPTIGYLAFFADGGTEPGCPGVGDCPSLDELQALVIDPHGQYLLVELANYAALAQPGGGVVAIDVAGDEALSQAFSPDATRVYIGTALGRIYEFAPTLPFPPYPAAGNPPGFLSADRIAITGFPVRGITVDPTGSRLLAFGVDSDQLWVVQ